jgi:hypothetical protein
VKKLRKAVILAELAKRMSDNGSWCGETHIQKAAFCLQELLKVPMGYTFVLYKHGPFSFDLRDEITEFRIYDLLRLEPRSVPYGPSLRPTNSAEELKERFPKTMAAYGERIDFVARILGGKGVAELERLATALFVTKKNPRGSKEQRAEMINTLKPHVSMRLALRAVNEIDEMKAQAEQVLQVEESNIKQLDTKPRAKRRR